MWEMPPEVNRGIDMLESAGFEAYAAGGCLRDIIMGKIPADYDLTTSAKPHQIKEVFKDYKTVDTGIAHGTVTVIISSLPIEITTYRIDGKYGDSRHPNGVTFTSSLEEDLKRRDFTVNAMAYNKKRGLVDVFGGVSDIRDKMIRCVGNPERRFEEDSLRIMRALRFSSVLGFDIESATAKALRAGRQRLTSVSAERLRDEFVKLLCGQNVKRILTEYADVLGVFLPEIADMQGFRQHNIHHIYDVLEHTAEVVAGVPPCSELRLAAMFHDIGKPQCFFMGDDGQGHFNGHEKAGEQITAGIMERLRFSKAEKEAVCFLVKNHGRLIEPTERSIKRALAQLTPEGLDKLMILKRADNAAQSPDYRSRQQDYDRIETLAREILEQEQCFSLKDLAVKGDDLIKAGFEPSPELGLALRTLLTAVIDGEVQNDREALLEMAAKLR